jgi:protein-disulfide isomerase/uncharacterized membrane protein
MEGQTDRTVHDAFAQPAPLIRWLGVIFAAAGWYFSYQAFRVSAGAGSADPLLQLVCGNDQAGSPDRCRDVLTSPQAYLPAAADPGTLRMPVSTLGMAYFSAVGLWYLFVGPASRDRRYWHLLLLAVVLTGLAFSLHYIHVMARELQSWCTLCLLAHAANIALVALSLLSWPRKAAPSAAPAHPSARLALATALAAGLCALAQFAFVFVLVAGMVLRQRSAEYAKVLDDPAFIRWHFEQQPAVEIPLWSQEAFVGSPDAPHTVVTFTDFGCHHCRDLHQILQQLVKKYPDAIRIAFCYYPQDPECNPDPSYRGLGTPAGCRAARAAEAARLAGGIEAYLRMRELLWERQNQLPRSATGRQAPAQNRFFEDCAVSIGLDREAFRAAFESPASLARIQASLELAHQLNVRSVPTVYLDGRRLINWRTLQTWEALLSVERPHPQPTGKQP